MCKRDVAVLCLPVKVIDSLLTYPSIARALGRTLHMYVCVCGLVYDIHVNAAHTHTYTRTHIHAYIVYQI